MVEDISMSLGDLKGRPLGEIEPHPIDFMIASDQWAKVQGIDSRDEEITDCWTDDNSRPMSQHHTKSCSHEYAGVVNE